MNTIAALSPAYYCVLNGFLLIGLAVVLLLNLAEVRAYHRGRLRRMAEQAKKKAQSVN